MSRRKLRIAYARITQETNAFSPVDSTMEDFHRMHFIAGDELGQACSPRGKEVDGMIRNAELSGFVRAANRLGGAHVETIPLFSAWAFPSGPLTEEAYSALQKELTTRLEAAGELDGVFLALHGAMRAHGDMREPEEGFLAAARAVVGPDVPIAVTFDLHGQLTPGKVDPATILVAYRTNPHRDLAKVGRRAGELLLRTLQGQIKPVTRWRTLPMVMGGGHTIDVLKPMRPIFARMRDMERDPRVLSTSLFMCHLWNDSPDLGWSVHVTTDDAPQLADTLADELAERAWDVRHVAPPAFVSPEEAIQRTRGARVRRLFGTFCYADVSDVVGAGGTGENTRLLRALIDQGQDLRAYLPLRDADAVQLLWPRDVGESVSLTVGGRLDPELNPAVAIEATVHGKHDTRYFGRCVTVAIGEIRLVLTELAPMTFRPSFYRDVGLKPWRADLVVVKSFFHFRFYFLALNRKSLGVRTKGITDLDYVTRIPFNDSVFPKDQPTDWREADRRRRAVPVVGA